MKLFSSLFHIFSHVFLAFLLIFSQVVVFFLPTKSVLAAPPPNFVSEILISSLTEPTAILFLPNGNMLILERYGRVHLVRSGNAYIEPTPFIDLRSVTNTDQGERGLTGVALDPEFTTNNYIYFFYTRNSPLRDRVSRFVVNGDTADLGSETVIWEDNEISPLWHHGGSIAFGPDGKLYISTGDGFDQSTSAQSLTSYRGKILRLNKDGTIPSDNPFYDGTGPNLDAIWALGLRNPFRFQFDPLSGRMYIGDVGGNDVTNSYEEINIGTAGANYGWPICEGPERNPTGGTCTPPSSPGTYQSPMHTYPHAGLDASVTGGFVYRGGNFPLPYKDSYFYGDYVRNWIKGLILDPVTGEKVGEFNFEPDDGINNGPYGEIVDLKQGPDGALYYVDIGISWEGGSNPGTVRRIRYVANNQPPVISQVTASPTSGQSPLTVSFSVSAYDPENEPLTYSWDFGDGTSSSEQNPIHTYLSNGRYQARLTVSDGSSQALSDPIVISVGTPPIINSMTVVSPSDIPGGNITFRAGDQISFSALATDPDGSLGESNYSWRIVMIHLSHTHPEAGPIIGSSGIFNIPTSGHEMSSEIQFQFILTVTDNDGLTAEQAVTIYPETVDLFFDSDPSGLQLLVDGFARSTPFSINSTIAFQHLVEAPSTQIFNGNTYNFVSWSDGGERIHTITVPEGGQTYQVNYQQVATLPSPIAGYSLNESSGNIAYDLYGTNNLTLINGPVWYSQGRFSGSLSFDGVDDRAVGSEITLPATFTLMTWVFNPSNSAYETLITLGTERDLYLTNGVVGFYDGAQDRTFGSQITTGTWHHIAIVSTGTQLIAYVDGYPVGSADSSLTPYTANLQLGAWIMGGNFYDFLGGVLDEVRIYSQALTQQEIQLAMNTPIGGNPPPPNIPPTANDDTLVLDEDTSASVSPLVNDSDPDGGILDIIGITSPNNGSAILNTDDTISYFPSPNFNGEDSFSYTISDGQGGNASATVFVSVNSVNDAPVANSQSVATAQNTSINLILSATDVDNDPLTFDIIDQPRNGILSGTPPNLSYTPNTNFVGSDTFTFIANDGFLNSNIATMTITVQASSYTAFSLQFDGQNDFARFTNIPLSQVYTYEAWVYRTRDTGRYETFLSDANSNYSRAMFTLYVDGGNNDCSGVDDQFAFYQTSGNDIQCSGVSALVGQWYHVAVTRDAQGTRRIFINGQLVSTRYNTPNTSDSNGRLTIGRAGDYNGEYFAGRVDEVRISNTARYVSSFTPRTSNFAGDSNTVALYHLDAGSGQILVDSSGNQRNGTLGSSTTIQTSDPSWSTSSPIVAP